MIQKILSVIILILIPLGHIAYAATIDDRLKACTAGTLETAADQYLCAQSELEKLNKIMKQQIEKAISGRSAAGEEATKEIRVRMQGTQTAWMRYRDGQCNQNYYSHASMHAPSQSYSAAMCMLQKTQQRIEEIQRYPIK